jgi:LPPG:FO 2-phospho-L-lactate transferase
VARAYAGIAGTLVIDDADAALADQVEATGMSCLVTSTVMRTADDARRLSTRMLDALSGRPARDARVR